MVMRAVLVGFVLLLSLLATAPTAVAQGVCHKQYTPQGTWTKNCTGVSANIQGEVCYYEETSGGGYNPATGEEWIDWYQREEYCIGPDDITR